MPRRIALPPIEKLSVRDFSGGPNIRDAQGALADSEVLDAWNVTFEERGGVGSRLGYVKYNGSAFTGGGVGVPKNIHFSGLLDNVITQCGTNLYLGTTDTIRKTFTTSARAVFADFAGKVYAGHPVDGLFHSTDGITWTAVADADRPTTCVAMAVWENQLYVIPANSNQFLWSDAGDGTAWTSSKFNHVRAIDDEPLVGFENAAGVDVQGRAGLIVAKRQSTYRIFDKTTGNYAILDPHVGAASALSITTVGNLTIILGERGLFQTDGVNPLKAVAERFAPLWDPASINYAQLDLVCGGSVGGKAYFSLPRGSSSVNDLSLEYDPSEGTLTPGSNAMSCYTTYRLNDEQLYGGSPTVSGQAYKLYEGGADDGAAIVSRLQTRWFEPNEGFLTRMALLQMIGRGPATDEPTLTVLTDWSTSGGNEYPLELADTSGPMYDSGALYDDGEFYGGSAAQVYQPIRRPGVCRSFSLRVDATTTTVGSARQILGSDTTPDVGAWALYGFDLLHVQLGIA